jgi:hypothetical protein
VDGSENTAAGALRAVAGKGDVADEIGMAAGEMGEEALMASLSA